MTAFGQVGHAGHRDPVTFCVEVVFIHISVTRYSDYPPQAKELPSVGSYINLNVEKIVSLRPDLCLATKDGNPRESLHWTIIWQIRLPRVLLAAAVGATLGVGGLVFQALLRNPLAEPYILGVSGGSAVGAVLGMMLGLRFGRSHVYDRL